MTRLSDGEYQTTFLPGCTLRCGLCFLLQCVSWVEDGKLPIGSDKVRSHDHTGPSIEFMKNGSGWLTLHLAHLSRRTLRTLSQPSLSNKGYQMLEIHLIAPKCLWAVQQLTKTCLYSGIFSSFSGAESSGMSGTGNSEQHMSHHAMASKARLRTYVLLSAKS